MPTLLDYAQQAIANQRQPARPAIASQAQLTPTAGALPPSYGANTLAGIAHQAIADAPPVQPGSSSGHFVDTIKQALAPAIQSGVATGNARVAAGRHDPNAALPPGTIPNAPGSSLASLYGQPQGALSDRLSDHAGLQTAGMVPGAQSLQSAPQSAQLAALRARVNSAMTPQAQVANAVAQNGVFAGRQRAAAPAASGYQQLPPLQASTGLAPGRSV